MRPKLGYLASPRHRVGLGHPAHLLGAAATIVRQASVDLPPCIVQDFQDCTGNSGALAIQCAMGKDPSGSWRPLPSRLFLYAFSRRDAGIPLDEDAGSYLFSTFDAAARLGFLPESRWSYDPQNLTREPDWEAMREAADQRIVRGAYRITSDGAEREIDVAAAIASGKVVVWGTELDQAFVDLPRGSVWPGVTGSVIGGHAMVLWAYRTNNAGAREFGSRSSWGADWCEGGSAWVSADAIRSDHAQDFWIVDAAVPHYSGEKP